MPKPDKQILIDDPLNWIADFNMKSIPVTGFYVYAILENNTICYIGKGKGNRVLSHFNGKGNIMLYSKIKGNQNIYDWAIVGQYQDEKDALVFEKLVIKKCLHEKVKLYNSVHYSGGRAKNELFKGIFSLLNDYEKRVFPCQISSTLTVEGLAELVISLIKDICSGVSKDKIPMYRSKPLDELSYYIRPEFGKNRVVIC